MRQARKNRLVYVILAECRLVFPEAQAPQPDHNVHRDAYKRWRRVSSPGEVSVSREGVQVSVMLSGQTPVCLEQVLLRLRNRLTARGYATNGA
jgi:hypothetical protein